MRGGARASDGRMSRTFFFVALAAIAGCGGGSTPGSDAGGGDDTGPGSDAGPGNDAGPAHDGGPGDDAWSPGSDAGGACMPMPGSATTTTGCDLLQLAVIAHDGAPSELVLTGRIYSTLGIDTQCALIDGVDIVESSATSPVVQHLDGGASIQLDSTEREIARGMVSPTIEAACGSDDPAMRFDTYGIVVRGRIDGGTFEAHCARAEGGGRWPPALRITCHRNVDAPPNSGNAMVSMSSFMGTPFSSTMFYASAPHGAGGALTTVDSSIHVIAQRSSFDPGPPIASFDTTGWTGTASESGSTPPYSQLQAFASTAQFDTQLCPPPMTGPPDPSWIPPPVFLARLTGMGGHGAYSTEVFVNMCFTSSS
jgi:hypothetical protein